MCIQGNISAANQILNYNAVNQKNENALKNSEFSELINDFTYDNLTHLGILFNQFDQFDQLVYAVENFLQTDDGDQRIKNEALCQQICKLLDVTCADINLIAERIAKRLNKIDIIRQNVSDKLRINMENNHAQRSYEDMFTKGSRWRLSYKNEQKKRVTIFNEKELALINPFDKMKSISTSNILELEEELGELNENEQKLIKKIEQAEFTVVHATPKKWKQPHNNNGFGLRSYKRLQQDKIATSKGHVSADIEKVGHDSFVFYSTEILLPGEVLSKNSSRFGSVFLVYPLNKVNQKGWATLDEQILGTYISLNPLKYPWVELITDEEKENIELSGRELAKNARSRKDTFLVSDLKKGIGLSMVLTIRDCLPNSAENIYSWINDRNDTVSQQYIKLNQLLGGFFRVEVKIPEISFLRPNDSFKIINGSNLVMADLERLILDNRGEQEEIEFIIAACEDFLTRQDNSYFKQNCVNHLIHMFSIASINPTHNTILNNYVSILNANSG